MGERLMGQAAQRALSDGGENGITQLLEPDAHESSHTVGDRQADRPCPKRPRGTWRFASKTIDGGLVKEGRDDRDDARQDQHR